MAVDRAARSLACWTPYPDINQALEALRGGVLAVLGERLIGLYLHGSLAGGDFNPRRSDIDFLAVTDGSLTSPVVAQLAAMHAQLAVSGLFWIKKMEGSYIPQNELRRYDPTHANHPALRVDGSFDIDHHASDWIIQRAIIRERGIALIGPHPRTLIDPVSPEEIRQAARGILREWWQPMLDDPYRLRDREYQAYAVLTMCRSLYTLETGQVTAKSAAAHWAAERLGETWHGVIQRALAWPDGSQPDELDQTLALLRLTLDQSCLPGHADS